MSIKAVSKILSNLIWLTSFLEQSLYFNPKEARPILIIMATTNVKVTDPVSARHNLSYSNMMTTNIFTVEDHLSVSKHSHWSA